MKILKNPSIIGEEVTEAAYKSVRVGKWYSVLIAIDDDNTAEMLFTDSGLKVLQNRGIISEK